MASYPWEEKLNNASINSQNPFVYRKKPGSYMADVLPAAASLQVSVPRRTISRFHLKA
ncbi:hypothetical protein RvY_17414 [Ramazzottius varieornatus]|uniref:Uncharacterized protein n=1 Tax=Ramazzottius varieornatus TaxID=947166 RepID=A0A1D1W207_RAMVA|nr:hypothetical protein RvY_17414 [Ramazzottius varieornatus]